MFYFYCVRFFSLDSCGVTLNKQPPYHTNSHKNSHNMDETHSKECTGSTNLNSPVEASRTQSKFLAEPAETADSLQKAAENLCHILWFITKSSLRPSCETPSFKVMMTLVCFFFSSILYKQPADLKATQSVWVTCLDIYRNCFCCILKTHCSFFKLLTDNKMIIPYYHLSTVVLLHPVQLKSNTPVPPPHIWIYIFFALLSV